VHINNESVGSFNFRVSHHNICPSVDTDTHWFPVDGDYDYDYGGDDDDNNDDSNDDNGSDDNDNVNNDEYDDDASVDTVTHYFLFQNMCI
jgi:hypothetical protein